MSAVKKAARRLERHRARPESVKVVEKQGVGKKIAKAARAVLMAKALERKKTTGKAVRELENLSVVDLKKKLDETRKELFDHRFKHATAQLMNVAAIPAAKRRIARILTLIKQKEVGA